MTVEVESASPESAQKQRCYLSRHWRGELSLAQSYWVNAVLVGIPINVYFRVVSLLPLERPIEFFEWRLIPFLLCIPLQTWQYVGIWRSAGVRIREGKPGWAWVARLVVIVGTIVV